MGKDITSQELENLLMKWHNIKQEIKELEKKEEKFKRILSDIMLDRDTDVLKSGEWKVTKRSQNIPRLLKKDVPAEVWNRYSTVTSFDAYYLSKNRPESSRIGLKNRSLLTKNGRY
jgi:hypothetical protein|tara:strand:- start:1 stop:348 length:348 start_codon:yes stop_codon:yes gene_type:complete